ncbi:MltA domain-containing protein [Bacteriovoracaceae bacterium]|nr:MltA domain-containing protein [Bacteriovoracaceae bacterium]
MRFLLLIALFSITSTFAQYTTPTKLYKGELNFTDDINFENVEQAVKRQLKVYRTRYNLTKTVQLGDRTVTFQKLKNTLLTFQKLALQYRDCTNAGTIKSCQQIFNAQIKQQFEVYTPAIIEGDPRHNDAKPALYTVYYSPDFDGVLPADKTEAFNNPIFKRPEDLELRKSTRAAIDFDDAFEGMGLEIFYVKQTLYDLYLLHIEGGGRVKVKQADGSIKYYYLSYNGSNKRSFNYIHKYMKERGYLTDDLSMATQKKFLADNPDKAREIFATCPSYIYFKSSKEEPVGIDDIPLTERRSMALDRKYYKFSGLLGFVQTKRPINETTTEKSNKRPTKDFSRFFIHQDTGGGIKGKARADLYAGFGDDAEFLANNFKYQGTMYFLLLK